MCQSELGNQAVTAFSKVVILTYVTYYLLFFIYIFILPN